jgi:hypothetical protein
MGKRNLWFTRRGKEVRGPFPAGMITRHILLGRLLETDELSFDQRDWKPVIHFTELYPEVMMLDQDDAENREKLRIAQMREDERQSGDRRSMYDEVKDDSDDIRYKRSGDERRDGETIDALRHREIKTDFRKTQDKDKPNYYFHITLVSVFLIAVVALAAIYSPKRGISINNCSSDAAPYVNWSNCYIEGMSLENEDLTGAQFRNSTINGADLRGARLVKSEFSYANLSNARLQAADLTGSVLIGATLRSANLSNTTLQGANLRFAIMHNTVLINADLRNTDLTHAMLNGADLNGAMLEGAILDKAIWTDNTVCAPESVGKCIPLTATP